MFRSLDGVLVLSAVCVACTQMTPLTQEQVACLRLAQTAGLTYKDLDTKGNANVNQGQDNLVFGKGNHIQGSNNCVVGFGNHVQGEGNSVVGGLPPGP